MFSNLLDRGCFCDVTIACEGLLLKAHRVVLVACSTYFDAILTNCSLDKEPIIVMRDCKYDDIKSLLDFMYKGEINVEHVSFAPNIFIWLLAIKVLIVCGFFALEKSVVLAENGRGLVH